MYAKILFALSISVIDCFYLEAESNYLKPIMERNNIVNKGVWMRNKLQDQFEQSNLGNFIFRPSSVDADNMIQNAFDKFDENEMQESPFLSKYVQRVRRSPDHIRKRRPRKSMKHHKFIKNSIEDSVMIKSKIVTDLKPTSVFNEYPYEVANLLNNESKKTINMTLDNELDKKQYNVSKDNGKSVNNTVTDEELKVVILTNLTDDVTKRSKKYDHSEDVNILIEEYNNTEYTDTNKQSREMFRKDDRTWNPSHYIPLPEKNIYKVIPRIPETPKVVTEKGLIKVITMLTKTFKKIIKQHSEIKKIHDQLANMNHDIDHKVSELVTKFEDFDSKYSDILQFNAKIKSFETLLNSQNQYFEKKQKIIEQTCSEFQSQQKKFLAQQKQFYSIQKLMLAQNEKINAKQDVIAKTQSEISHRQNNFARILKKTKQIIVENQTKASFTHIKPTDNKYESRKPVFDKTTPIPRITTIEPANTQAMKINLFSIPTKSKLKNQDALIIKEKDQKQIDDLVYKYYFNNTFIDFLMKSKILNNYDTNTNSVEIVARNLPKNKRDEWIPTTLLLPVNNSLNEAPVKRERRWINHFSKNKYRRLHRHRKETTVILNSKERTAKQESLHKGDQANEIKQTDLGVAKTDPFLTMATNFCNEIGQNVNEQVLKWCIEKALRRLKFMEMNAFTPPSPTSSLSILTHMKETQPQLLLEVTKAIEEGAQRNEPLELTTFGTVSVSLPTVLPMAYAGQTTLDPTIATMYAVPAEQETQTVFFPDNDQLESNLKQYDSKPDTEGNVYYEGSLHISDLIGKGNTPDDEYTSDFMPDLMESNSRIQIDPMAFDLQAKRRAFVRQLNENILKNVKQ